jgi:hypothetical protein
MARTIACGRSRICGSRGPWRRTANVSMGRAPFVTVNAARNGSCGSAAWAGTGWTVIQASLVFVE